MADDLRLRLDAADRHVTLIAAGELDAETAPLLLRVTAVVLDRYPARSLRADLSSVTAIDVAGVTTLVECGRRARATRRRFEIINPSGAVRQMLARCGATHLVSVRGEASRRRSADRRTRRMRAPRPPGRARRPGGPRR